MAARSRGLGATGAVVAGALLLLSTSWSAVSAGALPPPQGAPILIVDGAITLANLDGKAAFDLALLQSLPRTSITTDTPWTDGQVHFEGVRVRDLLARLGAQGRSVLATGTDEYRIEIPMADFQDYDVIIADTEDGHPLRPDNKGPLWIVYPFAANPALKKDIYFSRCVWQLTGLTVR